MLRNNTPGSHILQIASIFLLVVVSACTTVGTPPQSPQSPPTSPVISLETTKIPETLATLLPKPRQPGQPFLTPTPDLPYELQPIRMQEELYIVQPGDTLAKIANRYTVPLNTIVDSNGIENPDLLEVGQRLIIPPPLLRPQGSALKIIPNSELVNGPYNALFDLDSWVDPSSYLSAYSEDIYEQYFTGKESIARISQDYSVNPRLLLAILEYQAGWVAGTRQKVNASELPIVNDVYREGLYKQLAWLANNLNRGYYLWKVNALSGWLLADGSVVPISPTLNAGTAAIQYTLGLLMDYEEWQRAVGPEGILATYTNLFGYPFDFAIEPLIPPNLKQPPFQLPFEKDTFWSFTGGPHGAWGDGSAWGAIDFAPPGNALGCVPSDEWVTAAADGIIVRSEEGIVVLDVDQDGLEQTGWNIFYLHMESRGRVDIGQRVEAGDRIGHPSCEGGASSGTHVHIARKYNGEWISADGDIPFHLDGWVSEGIGIEYDGYLRKNNLVVEAWNGRDEINQIKR